MSAEYPDLPMGALPYDYLMWSFTDDRLLLDYCAIGHQRALKLGRQKCFL